MSNLATILPTNFYVANKAINLRSLLFSLCVILIAAIGCKSAIASDLTVEDAVNAEWYVKIDSARGYEGEIALDADAYSPDGTTAVFLTRLGNLSEGANAYTIHLAQIDNGYVTSRELLRLSSTSNRPAIVALRWISNERVAFIGVGKDGYSQVMSVNLSGELVAHTNGPEEITGFDLCRDGTVVYRALNENDSTIGAENGIGYIVADEILDDIIGKRNVGLYRRTQFFVRERGETRHIKNLSTAVSNFTPQITISPSCRYAVVANSPRLVPPEWEKYPLLFQATASAPPHSSHSKLSLTDLQTNEQFELSGGPMAWPYNQTQIVWDEANERIFLIDQFMSVEQASFLDGLADQLLPATFEFSLRTMRPARLIDVSPAPEPYAQNAGADSARFNAAADALEIIRGDRLIRYEETPEGWRREGARAAPERPFTLEVRQSVSEPAQMYASVAGGQDPVPVGEINTHLRKKFNPAQLYTWTDEAGRKWEAGLILPKGAQEGEALPLIIQTHTFSPDEFVITGDRGSSAGFAAQALASAGFAVLVMGIQNRDLLGAPEEFETQSDGYRSAIKALTAEGVIDPARVGIVAWSRSGFWLQHALAYQNDLFAAAIAADPSTFGKFGYLYFYNWPSPYQSDYLIQNDALPFGAGLDVWRERDPVTHVDAFTTPLLIEHYGEGIPLWWEPYVAMKDAGEPVEYFILPDAPHDPIQPQHRLVVQTLTLDWFHFWLQGYEDPVPEKAEQYTRWRKMRDERCAREDLEIPAYCQQH